MKDNTMDNDTPMYTESVTSNRAVGFASSKSTIPSVLESQQALLENVFDEISRLEERITPFLGMPMQPTRDDSSAKAMEDPGTSPTLSLIMKHNSRLDRVARLLSGLTARVDS